MVKIPKRLPVYMNEEQSKKFVSCSKTGRNSTRNYCMAVFFINIGMRLSELRDLNLSSIDKDKIYIIGKGDKERYVHLNDICKNALKDWLAVRPKVNSSALFISEQGNRISTQAIQKIVKETLSKAKINNKKLSTHKLRHTCATLLLEKGADISAIKDQLGHEDIKTTQIYIHVTDKKRRETANLINIG
jgi:site-specific recombinase XerD